MLMLAFCYSHHLQEVHKQCYIANCGEGQKVQRKFLRNKYGKVVKENEEYRSEETKVLNVKYEKEARFCFGVAMKIDANGKEHGCKMPLFDYTQKKIITLAETSKKVDAEVAKVKAMLRNSKQWMSHPREDGVLYMDDPVTMIADVGPTKGKLLNSIGIQTVGCFVGFDDESLERIAKTTPGLSILSLKKFRDNCGEVKNENAPHSIYYIEHENPYIAKYGETVDEWGEEVWRKEAKKQALNGCVCITDLLKHIVIHTKELYKDTPHFDTYYFYHDALSQLTADACVAWMQETTIPGENKKIYDRWVKPELGLNDRFGKKWRGRPLGNSPELMPLDNSLNQDLHKAVRFHVSLSTIMFDRGDTDPRIFLLTTPKSTASAYSRIWEISPTSERILQDIKKWNVANYAIVKAEGVYVEGLAGGNKGNCHTSMSWRTETRGGRRVRGEYDPSKFDKKMHPDLRDALDEHGDRIMSSIMFASISDEDEVDDDDDFDHIEDDGDHAAEAEEVVDENESDNNDED